MSILVIQGDTSMIERETARRVFAHEFNHSDYFFHEGDERSPNYLITPTGAKINRLYFVGVLTEMDNIGAGEDMWRGRVSDPTGAFAVYAGQYQPEAAVFLSDLDIPSFVAVVGKARVYEPEEGTLYTSVRPEELNTAQESIRDRWVVDTARLTFERIKLVRAALGSGLKDEELHTMLVRSGAGAELADGIDKALKHYLDLDRYLDKLLKTVIAALHTLLPEEDTTSINTSIHKAAMQHNEESEYMSADSANIINNEDEEPDAEAMVYELMGRLDTGKGVPVAELMEESNRCGLTEDQVDDAVKSLMSEGKCYEPRIGLLRKV
jgi:RPA family protein